MKSGGPTRNPIAAPRKRRSSLFAHGESMRWLTAGALVVAVAMIVGLLAFVASNGFPTFWPGEVVVVRLDDGASHMGEVSTVDAYVVSDATVNAASEASRARVVAAAAKNDGRATRRLLRVGNFDVSGEHYRWIEDWKVVEESRPEWALVVERETWGRFYGEPVAFMKDGEPFATGPEAAFQAFEAEHEATRERLERRRAVEKRDIGAINDAVRALDLKARRAALDHGAASAEARDALEKAARARADAEPKIEELRKRVAELDAENGRYGLAMRTASGVEKTLPIADVVRAYPANRLSFGARLAVYFDRWREFLVEEPREANTEGGIYPALFGTVVMTLLMSLVVVPFGVLAALYLREYAKQGFVTAAIRIAVNNLAGVPSIVFGVFGLGFFCYAVGGRVDALFFPERLPSPTFGTGGVLWASATLALLTLPVVIVSAEEALAAVPRSMREGSYACGASKWQTMRRIVLPRAAPGVMTGMILAMARGAGEVAPLMLVGVVKLAHELPVDGTAPFLHPERSFMHLGFHIFDLGFQSQNSEASKPMVYVTTTVLISVVVLLNVAAVMIRSRLRRRFVGGAF